MELKLPLTVINRQDVLRLLHELREVDNQMLQAVIKQEKKVHIPHASESLISMVRDNAIDIGLEQNRKKLIAELENIKHTAPVVHVSFANEPSSIVMQKLVLWWRREVHPRVLLHVGLQPSIAIGCVVRTPNHQFDFSLKRRLLESRGLLAGAIGKDER